MAVFECKMCGGNLDVFEGSTTCECKYCDSSQTVPVLDNEKKITLFARANQLRRNCEFDKASGVYESIITEFPEEAEAYWGLILCKYGIEYVDDPQTGNKIPTCHPSSFDSVLDGSIFHTVMDYSDDVSCWIYLYEARAIEKLVQTQQKNELEKQINTLTLERSSLGLFQRKRKKELTAQIKQLQDRLRRALALLAHADFFKQIVYKFRMPVEDIFTITGRGTAVTGRISQGTVHTMDKVEILHTNGTSTPTIIKGIELFRKTQNFATEGDNAGLILAGIDSSQVTRGDLIIIR